jgi:hypothetical protein
MAHNLKVPEAGKAPVNYNPEESTLLCDDVPVAGEPAAVNREETDELC